MFVKFLEAVICRSFQILTVCFDLCFLSLDFLCTMDFNGKHYGHLPFEVFFKDDIEIREMLMLSVPFVAMNPHFESEPQKFCLNTSNISSSHFPVMTKAIPTGSRVERLFTDKSDVDYIIECGPITVSPKIRPKIGFPHTNSSIGKIPSLGSKLRRSSSTRPSYKYRNISAVCPGKNFKSTSFIRKSFYCKPTCHPGFYQIFDREGFNIHPGVLQIQLAPYLMNLSSSTSILKEMKKQECGKAALPEYLCAGNEDNVIALRLSCWPAIVKRGMRKQVKEEILEALLGLFVGCFLEGRSYYSFLSASYSNI